MPGSFIDPAVRTMWTGPLSFLVFYWLTLSSVHCFILVSVLYSILIKKFYNYNNNNYHFTAIIQVTALAGTSG